MTYVVFIVCTYYIFISIYCLLIWVYTVYIYGACTIIYKVNNNKCKTRYLII